MRLGENTDRQGMGVRVGFREVQRLSLAWPLGQHLIQHVAIQIRQSLPRPIKEKLKKIYSDHIWPRNRGGPGQGLLRLFGSPELNDSKIEKFRPAFLERADFICG